MLDQPYSAMLGTVLSVSTAAALFSTIDQIPKTRGALAGAASRCELAAWLAKMESAIAARLTYGWVTGHHPVRSMRGWSSGPSRCSADERSFPRKSIDQNATPGLARVNREEVTDMPARSQEAVMIDIWTIPSGRQREMTDALPLKTSGPSTDSPKAECSRTTMAPRSRRT